MIDEKTALKIANGFTSENKVITSMKDKGGVWLVSYNNKDFAETRKWNRDAYGYLPILIDKQDGEVHQVDDPVVIFPNQMDIYIDEFLKRKYGGSIGNDQ